MMFLIIGILLLMLLIAVAVGVFFMITYNELVKRRNKVKNSWAHVDAQLQRRFDLVPNLVSTVKGMMVHERQLVESVSESISRYMNARDNKEKIVANEQLTNYLKSLFDVTSNYPQLKSNANFLQLQSALTEIEEDISYARQFYNDAVTIYNNKLMTFPNNIVASMFKFEEETLFDAFSGNEPVPTVQLQMSKHIKCPHCGAIVANRDSIVCDHCGCSLV